MGWRRHERRLVEPWATGRVGWLVVITMGAVSACAQLPFGRGDAWYLDAGEAEIEDKLADPIGFGPLDAACEGDDLGAGDTFVCTARAADREPIRFVATISGDGEDVDLAPTNLLLAERVEQIEGFAAALLTEETGRPIAMEQFECADSSVVVAEGEALDCRVTDPSDGTVYAVGVTIDDLAVPLVTVAVGEPVG